MNWQPPDFMKRRKTLPSPVGQEGSKLISDHSSAYAGGANGQGLVRPFARMRETLC